MRLLFNSLNEEAKSECIFFSLSLFMSCFRSSDGVCTAGTVVVSRLKMGEMEEVDVDQITTDIPSQKVRLAGWLDEAGAGVSMCQTPRANTRIRQALHKSSNEIK